MGPLLFEIKDFDADGDISVVEVAGRLRLGLDVEKVTKKFYREFQEQHLAFIELIAGIADDRQRRWYASVLLNRLMFIWFLQRKGFVDDGNLDYLREKLEESRTRGSDRYFGDFLKLLFFEGFAKPAEDRSPEARHRLGNIRYLNGGLFLPHAIESSNPHIHVPDAAFENLFALFRRYSWNLNDTPGTDSDEINPDVLGYIFEKYINQKAFGAYYTRPEITEYLCERTIHRLVLDAVNTSEEVKSARLPGKNYDFRSIGDLLLNLDTTLCRKLLFEVLPRFSILDPACGSGAFLVAAMKTLIRIYGGVIGQARFLGDADLKRRVAQIERNHPNIDYYIKKSIITNNLYGVDIMEEAVEIARLRLFLALVSSAHTVDQLEPLPNIDFNLLPGNSVIGLMRVDETKFDEQASMIRKTFRQVVDEKNRRIATYRDATSYATDLRDQRDDIDRLRAEASESLHDILLGDFQALGIRYEEATWDDSKHREGKAKKRPLRLADIRDLEPFHWGYEFDEIVNRRGGFDAIITNPPWDTFKPYPKEFFEQYSDLVTKKTMDVHEFEREQSKLLSDPEIRVPWLRYLSGFPHQNLWFRSAPEYENQTSFVDERKVTTDLNLYKLFLERCFRLLRVGGDCGIVIPSSIYTDLGSKRLRELLFSSTEVTGLFGFENRRQIFENVDSRFKFVVLTFRKGVSTSEFPAAFMRHDVGELERFPSEGGVRIAMDVVRRLSPDSLSLPEFRSESDLEIVEKMSRWPLLRDEVPGSWRFELHREFHITDDARLFESTEHPGMVRLFEGKMIHQFDSAFSPARSFVSEKAGHEALAQSSHGRADEYLQYRLGYRRVGRSTDERAMIATVLPKSVFAADSVTVCASVTPKVQCYLAAVLNSFAYDWFIRLKISATLNMFYVYQTPVPRLQSGNPIFEQLVNRAAKLICTLPEFGDLARGAGINPAEAVQDKGARDLIRAEIDAIVAHMYGLTEVEFAHILSTFPIVQAETKDRILAAFRDWKPPSDDPLLQMIAAGESLRIEFKSSARWDYKRAQVNKELEHVIVKTIAALMNSDGGTLLIGVADDGSILGLDADYQTLGKKNADAYENWLVTRLLESIGRDRTRLLRVGFRTIEGKTICRVDVERSSRPVYVKDPAGVEKFYVRTGNSTRELSISEYHAYADEHFSADQRTTDSMTSSDAPAHVSSTRAEQGRLALAPQPAKHAAFPTYGLFSTQLPAKPVATTEGAAVEEAPADPVDVPEPASDAPPRTRLVNEYGVEDVLLYIRDVVKGSDPVPREDAIREIATLLGAERVGPRIRDLIESALTTASRRAIIETAGRGLVARTHSIDDYDREFLRSALKNVMGRSWTEQSEAIRAATRWLGFRRTGSTITAAFQSAIRGAIRQRLVERDGTLIRFLS